MKTILAPIDFSGVTDAVVAEAAVLAKSLNGKVVFMTVIQPPVVMNEYAVAMESIAELTAAGEKNAARNLANLEERLQSESLPVASLQVVGAPIPLIVEQAKKLEADYIVMGSHGHTALYDLLVGSTTHGVLMRAACPVVIVPAPKNAKNPKARKK